MHVTVDSPVLQGAVLSHAAFHVQSLNKLLAVGYCADDVHYHAAPLCHVGMPLILYAGAHILHQCPGLLDRSRA